MLRIVLKDIYDKEITVTDIVKLNMNIEEDVPADDMSAVFLYFHCDELKSVVLYDDDVVVFTGIVDEQQLIRDVHGEYIKIVCRSMAGVLLDNESMPMSYTNPSVSVMSSRHLKPFGVSVCGDRDGVYFGTQMVLKGDSNFKTVQDFSKIVYGSAPRVNEYGQLCFPDYNSGERVVFSDRGEGIVYHSLVRNIRRCDELSKVRMKLSGNSGYDAVIENKDAISRGIIRERYLDAVPGSTPAVSAQRMIKNSRKKAYSLTLTCSGRHLNILLRDAVVNDSVVKIADKLYVSSLRYSLSDKGDYTVVTLKRKEV